MYSKEFVDLIMLWIKGNVLDKNLFEQYFDIMKENSFNSTGFRIWSFEGEELKNVIFNEGDLEIESNFIESCFQIPKEELVNPFGEEKQHIENYKIDQIQKWLSPYLDDFRIITRWSNSIYFDPYKVLEYGINEYNNGNIEYSQEDFEKYKKTLNFYKHQNEILHLGKFNNISSDEVLYLLVNKNLINELDNEELNDVIYDELSDYYVFYNDETTRDVIWYHSNLKNEFNSIIKNLEL